MDVLTRRRAMLWLERSWFDDFDVDERSRGYNPAPGRQVFTAEGARKYGLPIGATILPGVRALTKAQHDEVAAMDPDVRARYLQARAQGHTHAAARKAAGGTAPPRKAASAKATKAARPAGVGDSVEGKTADQLRQIAKAEGIPLPTSGTRAQLARIIEDHRFHKSSGGLTFFSTTTGEVGAPPLAPAKKATPRAGGTKVTPKAATAPAKKATSPRSPDGVPHLVTYDEDSDSWTVSGVPARDRARVAKSVHTYWDQGQDVNDYLRQGPDAYGARKGKKLAPATAQRTVDDLDTLFDSSRTDRPVEVWRGFGGRTQFGDNPDAWPDDLTGHEWTDAGYVSTAADRAEAGQFVTGGSGGPTDRRGVMARVSVPEGAPVLSLSDFEATELLLSRGWKFRVTRDHGWQTREKRSGAVRERLLDIEAIPPDDGKGTPDARIRSAYEDLTRDKEPGDWVSLADLREHPSLRGMSREEQDAALKRLATQPGVRVIPVANAKTLTKREHDASFRIGGEDQHAIAFEPAAPARKATAAKKAAPRRPGNLSTSAVADPENFKDRPLIRKPESASTSGRPETERDGLLKLLRQRDGSVNAAAVDTPASVLREMQNEGLITVHDETPDLGGVHLSGPVDPQRITDAPSRRTYQRIKLTDAGREALGDPSPAKAKAANAAVPKTSFSASTTAPDPKSLEGLTVRQQRARLRAMGFSKEQIDELAPTAAAKDKGPRVTKAQVDGLSLLALEHTGGTRRADDLKPTVAEALVRDGFATRDGDRLSITDKGRAALNSYHATRFDAEAAALKAIGGGGASGDLDKRTVAEVEATLSDVTSAANLRRVATQLRIQIPTNIRTAAEIRRFIAETIVRDRTRWSLRSASELGDDDADEFDEEEEPIDELDLALEHYEPEVLTPATRARMLAMTEIRAAGHDITPGHDQLHHYWTRGEGLAKWVGSPKPWTTLVAHLTKYVGLERAKRFASRWFIEVFHFAAGSDLNRVMHGHPPRGHIIGPDRSADDDDDEDRAGYSPRHKYPGQKYVHGWIPVELAEVIQHISRWHEDPKDVDDLARAVSRGATHAGPLSYGRSHRTRAELTDFGDGTDGIVTDHLGGDPVRDADADQLGSTLARSMGIPAPRKMRVADDMTADELVDGQTWAEREAQILGDIRPYQLERPQRPSHGTASEAQRRDLERQRAEMLASDAALRLGVFDLLAGIDERDSGTIVLTPSGVVPVQSEFGWVYAEGRNRAGEVAAGRLSKADGKVAPVERRVKPPDLVMWSAFSNLRSWRDNPLTPADVAFLRARLDAAQPQFAKLGRMRWWQFASDRLDALARHAKGTRNLFPSE